MLIKIALIILLLPISLGYAEDCKIDAAMSSQARNFMKKNNLIHQGDESKSAVWGIYKVTTHEDKCLYIMQICPVLNFGSGKEVMCTGDQTAHFEIIVKKDESFIIFEKAFKIPASIRLGFGSASPSYDQNGNFIWSKDFYYVELIDRQSIIDSMKAINSKFPYSGFSADLSSNNGRPDGKLIFDPTLGRKWKVINAKYSLRRGATAEIHDVRSGHLDDDFEAYFQGSAGHVAPWGNAAPMKLYNVQDKHWIDIKY